MKRGVRTGVVITTAVIVSLIGALVAGYFIRDHLAKTTYGPQGRVESYLAALVEGRATDAIALLDPDVTSAERVLLTDEVYRSADIRPTGYEILDVRIGEKTATVDASLTMDAKRYPVAFELRKSGTVNIFFDDWTLTSGPRQSIQVSGAAIASRVNGAQVNLTSVAVSDVLAVLPGSYIFDAPKGTDHLSFGSPQTVVVVPGAAPAEVAFYQSWTPAASTDAIAQVNERIATCMTSNKFHPAGCENVLAMTDPGYAVTAIERRWLREPAISFDDGVVLIDGGEMKIDYKWRWSEDDTWEPDHRSYSHVFEMIEVPVTIGDDGTLALDFSAF